MRKRIPPRPVWPPQLAEFRPGDWVDRFHWSMARWAYWQEHREELPDVDPIELLRERREARLNAAP